MRQRGEELPNPPLHQGVAHRHTALVSRFRMGEGEAKGLGFTHLSESPLVRSRGCRWLLAAPPPRALSAKGDVQVLVLGCLQPLF